MVCNAPIILATLSLLISHNSNLDSRNKWLLSWYSVSVSRLLLLLGAVVVVVVGVGPRLAVASSGTLESFCCSGKW